MADIAQLRAYVEFMAREMSQYKGNLNLYQFLIDHGTYMEGRKRPKGFRKQANKMCYRNAQQMAVLYPDQYTYCEGIAVNTIPTQHGWLVDTDGNVIDPTWRQPEQCVYLGVRIKHEYLADFVVRTKLWTSILGCYTHDNDLLTGVTPIDQALYL
jgi:hypothetical protein